VLSSIKSTVHPGTEYEGTEREKKYSYTLSFTSEADGMGG